MKTMPLPWTPRFLTTAINMMILSASLALIGLNLYFYLDTKPKKDLVASDWDGHTRPRNMLIGTLRFPFSFLYSI